MMKVTFKALRTNFGLSRADEARLLHVSPWTVANYEDGVHAPTGKTLISIAELYHVPLKDITLKPKISLPSTKGGNDNE